MNPCPHEDFHANVEVNRLRDGDAVTVGFSADISIRCTACGEPFRFIGVPPGLSPAEPRASIDGTELRAPIQPLSGGFGGGYPGFDVQVRQ